MFSLAGKTIVVTGGGRGLGKAISRAMAKSGANVVVAGRTPARLEETVGELRTYDVDALAVRTDITDPSDVRNLMARTTDIFGHVDCWVNNAGGAVPSDAGPLLTCDEGMWDRVVDLNLKWTFFCAQAAVGVMPKGGSIINISSRAGSGAAPNLGWYGAAKAGLESLTATMAVEWGHLGIRVNAVAPGLIPTDDGRSDSMTTPSRRARQVETVPLQRLGVPDDIGGICVFLASDEAAWITGQVIGVNGGSTIPVGLTSYLWHKNRNIADTIRRGEI